MKIVEKIKLMERVAIDLENRFNEDEIQTFFVEFKLKAPETESWSNNFDVLGSLRGVNTNTLISMADDLDISTNNLIKTPPMDWRNADSTKVFISHLAKDKDIAKRTKDSLFQYNIEGFIAHEDIEPSKQWQDEIEKALDTMDFFIAIHTEGFSQSFWCQQEVGFAVAKGIEIISIKFGEDPTGFIGKYQAINRGNKTAENVTREIVSILKNSEKAKYLYSSRIAPQVSDEKKHPY